jgi:repressor LexA
MARRTLTKRQAAVLDFIIDHIEEWGYPPTIREIGDHLGIKSTNGVNDHLKALERKNYLERQDAKSRALKPLRYPDGSNFEVLAASSHGASYTDQPIHDIPVVGHIAAGMPTEAIENTEDFVKIGEGLIGRDEGLFSLRVNGDSMIEDGIFNGDYIFVKPQKEARDGEIVACMVDGEATVKRFYREGDSIRLQPANSYMEPIYVHAREARETIILGKVVAVFRRI